MDLSVIMVTISNKDKLKQCLKSVYSGRQDISFETFVSDNGSTDGTASMVKTCFPQVVFLENGANLGFAKANNRAIKKSRGRYILLLNDDTVILDNALSKMVTFMDEHLKCGISGCKLIYPDGSIQSSKFSYPSLFKEFFHANDFIKNTLKISFVRKLVQLLAVRFKTFESFALCNEIKEVDDVLGAFFIIRREVIDKIGLLDENYWMCREESDFSYRARKAGYKVFYNPRAAVIHFGNYTVHGNRERKVRNYCQNFISANYFYRKHYSVSKQLLLKPIVLEAFSVKLAIAGCAYLFRPSIRYELKRNMVQYIDAMWKVMVNSTERAL
jgi:hypothetical protein